MFLRPFVLSVGLPTIKQSCGKPQPLERLNAGKAFAYNGLSQRVGKLDSGGQFGYTLAGDSIDANVLADGQASYQYGAGLVSEVRGGVSKAYHADALGTTRAMSGANGATTDTLETDAFGNTVSKTGSSASPFGFAGQSGYQTDADSGLMRLGYRLYDASVGRFISRDPIQDGYNWYVYVGSNPANIIDPRGLDWIYISYEPGGKYGVHIRVYIPNPPNYPKEHPGDWYGQYPGKGVVGGDTPRKGNPILPIDVPHEDLPKIRKKLYWALGHPQYNLVLNNCSDFVKDILNVGVDDPLLGRGNGTGATTPKDLYNDVLGDSRFKQDKEQKQR